MKRVLMAIGIVLIFSVAVFAIQSVSTGYPKIYKLPATTSAMVWQFSAPGYKNATVLCTLATVDAHGLHNWAMWLRRSTDGDCDSCHATIYRDVSFDGSNWTVLDTTDVAGKVADTLGMAIYFRSTKFDYKDTVGLAATGSSHTVGSWKVGPWGSSIYMRIRMKPNNAANCSTYYHAPKLFAEP